MGIVELNFHAVGVIRAKVRKYFFYYVKMKITTFSVILHLISGLNAEAIADSEGLEIFQPILPVQVDLSMITDILAELKENIKTVMTQTKAVMTQTKAMENRIKTVEKQVQSELEKRLAALEKKILEPINPTIPVAPTIPVTPTKAITPTKSPVDPITGLKWSSILGGCVKPEDANGWILLQQRDVTAKNAFALKYWNDYKNGFQESGNAYWLGLQEMHEKTLTGRWKVVLAFRCEGQIKCLAHEDFKVDSENANFMLHLGPEVNRKDIPASETFSYSSNNPFSTIDRENDKRSDENCAREWEGGWWHEDCYYLCLNCKDPIGKSSEDLIKGCDTYMTMKNM